MNFQWIIIPRPACTDKNKIQTYPGYGLPKNLSDGTRLQIFGLHRLLAPTLGIDTKYIDRNNKNIDFIIQVY